MSVPHLPTFPPPSSYLADKLETTAREVSALAERARAEHGTFTPLTENLCRAARELLRASELLRESYPLAAREPDAFSDLDQIRACLRGLNTSFGERVDLDGSTTLFFSNEHDSAAMVFDARGRLEQMCCGEGA